MWLVPDSTGRKRLATRSCPLTMAVPDRARPARREREIMADDRQNLTAAPTTTPSFRRVQPPSRWVGVLTPIAGLSAADIQLEQDELVVGRDKDCGVVLSDEGVSRRHA